MKTEELTQQRPEQEQTAGKLLSPEDRGVCRQLTAGEAPWSQRAQALLALDEGATQAGAGSQAGLSQGQVSYWLGRYRDGGLSIFPEAELSQTQPEPVQEAEASPQAVAEEAAATADKPKQKKKKKKKKKKKRKAKKAKAKSGRSDKKSKKKGKK
jgi:outer membrane biosynthesis protein TonB